MCPEGKPRVCGICSGCQEEWGQGQWDAGGSDTLGVNPAWLSATPADSL